VHRRHPWVRPVASAGSSVARRHGRQALAHARDYDVDEGRRIVQYLLECARYDPEVTYTLVPGAK